MLDAKGIMLHFMAMSGTWPDEHTMSIVNFFFNLEAHQRKEQKNGNFTLLFYMSCVQHEWFDALKCHKGFNIALIEEDLLHTCVEEVNNNIRDRENAIWDRENAI